MIRIRRKGDGKGITFSERVSPACLPRRAFEEGKECFIAGWGKTHGSYRKQQIKTRYLCDIAIFPCFSVHGKKSNCLQSAKVPLISERECRRMYADSTRDIDRG